MGAPKGCCSGGFTLTLETSRSQLTVLAGFLHGGQSVPYTPMEGQGSCHEFTYQIRSLRPDFPRGYAFPGARWHTGVDPPSVPPTENRSAG